MCREVNPSTLQAFTLSHLSTLFIYSSVLQLFSYSYLYAKPTVFVAVVWLLTKFS